MKNVVLIIGFAALIVGTVTFAFWPKAQNNPENPPIQAERDSDGVPEPENTAEGSAHEQPIERSNPPNLNDNEDIEAITRWTLGAKRRYSVLFQRTVAVGPPASPVAKQVHSVSGSWSFTITDGPDDAGHYRARAKLEVSDWSMTDLADDVKEAVLAALSEPYFLVLKPSGAMADLLFPSTIHARAREVLVTLSSVAQQSESHDGKQAWRSDEIDQYGTYTAVYRQRTEDSDSGENRILQRMKAGYTHLNTQLPPEMVPSIHHKTRFTMAQHGWYRLADVTETQEVAASDNIPEVHSSISVTLSYISSSRDDAAIGSYQQEKSGLTSFTTPTQGSDSTPDDDRTILGDTTLAQILDALRSLAELRADDAARDAWIPKLSALFRLYPDQTMVAVAAIQDGMQPWTAVTILSGLAGAETPQSHEALVSMLTWAASDGKAMLAPVLAAFGQSRIGSKQAVDGLMMLAKAQSSGSPHLPMIGGALAMQAAALDGPDGVGSAQAWVAVEQLWAGDQNVETKAALVGEIGKSQFPKALTLLTDAVQHPESTIRANAATALGDWSGEGVDKTLLLLIQNDTSTDVRRAAILSSIGRNSDAFLEAYEAILSSYSTGADVFAVLRALEQTPAIKNAFKDQLAKLKTTSTDPEIAAMADKLLQAP